MSLWVSSSALLRTLVLTALLMHLGCIAAGTAKTERHPVQTQKINSTGDLQSQMQNFNEEIHKAEHDFASIQNSTTSLRKSFNEYSKKSARHAWSTAREQQNEAEGFRKKAQQLQNAIETFKKHYQPLAKNLQNPEVRRFVRNGPNRKQMQHNMKIYEILINTIETFLDCPMHIMEVLNSSESQEGGSSVPYDGGDGGESGETVFPEYY